MDFSHEFLTFQHGNQGTNEKLEYYQNFIMILLGELKLLREAVCTPCNQKWAASFASITSRSFTTSNTNNNPTFHLQNAMLYYIFYFLSLHFILTLFIWFVDVSNWPGYARTCCFSFIPSIFLYYLNTQWNRAQTLRVNPATPVSELPPSPIDFSYEFLMFQHGNHDAKEKLEYYQSFIITLLGALKSLREAICASCQQRYALSKAGNQMKPCNVEDRIPTLPQMPDTDVFWRNPTFYAERGALADSTIDVTFVDFFRHENYATCVCFSRDGRYMAVGTGVSDKDGSIFIYEVESHKKYCELREYASQYGSYTRLLPWDLCFNSDGRYLAVIGGAERIIIWDVPKKRIRNIVHGSHKTSEVRFSHDGRLLAFRTNAGLVLLNVRDNSRKLMSEGSYFDFSPDGRYIATGNDNILIIMDVRTGKDVKRWSGHGTYLRDVKFTSDGRGLSCAYNDVIERWDVSDVTEPVLIRKLDFQSYYFYRTSISADHRIFAYNNDLWDANSGKCQYTLQGHKDAICSVDFSAAGTYMAIGSWDGYVSLWRYTWT